MRINYPATWTQSDRDALDEMFDRARATGTWLFHGGLSGPLWFSPDELQAEQEAGNFVWGAVNWQLRNPQEAIASIDRQIETLQRERMAIADRIRKAAAVSETQR